MTYEYVKLSCDESVLTVSLNRPPVNAVTQEMYRELTDVFSDVHRFGDDVRVVLLRAEGRHFCGGNDLEEFVTMSAENAPARMRVVRAAFFAISRCSVPVIAAVRGSAVGTGLAIAASADFIIAARDAKFTVPEVSVGVMGAARHLMRLVPQPVARWAYLTAEPLTAEQMHSYGAVVALADPERLDEVAAEHARLVSRHGPTTLRFAKRAMNVVEAMELEPGYRFEQGLTCELTAMPEAREALAATRERRAPQFSPAQDYDVE